MQPVSNTPQNRSLAQIVCEWQPSQLSQITAQFSQSSSSPRTTFPTYHSYKAYFEPLLLAEVSAELFSALDKYQRAPNLRHTKIRARREESGTTLATVTVHKLFKTHPPGFGWIVDVETSDRRGPVGCVDNDIVVLWPTLTDNSNPNRNSTTSRNIPQSAVISIVRNASKKGCRLLVIKFPDGNENGLPSNETQENGNQHPPRRWNVLRVGSLTTVRREFEALQNIKNSVLLPVILRPQLQQLGNTDTTLDTSTAAHRTQNGDPEISVPTSEHFFTSVIVEKTGLNTSQARAIIHASTTSSGFSVIQGPPGTGKTRTLIGLLNVVHMTHYQKYYEGLLASLEHLHGSAKQKNSSNKAPPEKTDDNTDESEKAHEGSLLESMIHNMSKTISVATDINTFAFPKNVRRPRLLVCAPSNSAVDEILTRLVRSKFIDGQGRQYCPELARIGAGDRVSDAAKPLTAEGQAEKFLDRVCGEEMNEEARKAAQRKYLASWQNRCNTLLVQLSRTPKDQGSSQSVIIQLHENLERLDRDMRRLRIAVTSGKKVYSREDKLRMIARTYVEDAQLVFATLSGSASSILTRKGSSDLFGDSSTALFDTVVIDEGAQATETSCLIPLTLGATRCLLVGDPQQLPATVLSSGAAGLAYGQSLLERVCKAGRAALLLDTQYRMHPAISSFPRRYFYNGRLVDDESVQGEHRARVYHRHSLRPKFGPYVFLDISEGQEKRSRSDKSVFNPAEAELAALIYTKLKKEFAQDSLFSAAAKTPGSVTGFGVVTPYKRQMQELRQSFDRAGVPTGDVEIDTVDSYQGREKEFVVFSCVRTVSLNQGIGFVRDVRRMNVGLTRARASLIILGSAQALAEGSKDWAELVEDANSRGCLISVTRVSRCLEPASPQKHSSPLKENSDSVSKKNASDVARPQKPQIQFQRSTAGHNSINGPTDPRKRMSRRDPRHALIAASNKAVTNAVDDKSQPDALNSTKSMSQPHPKPMEEQHPNIIPVQSTQPELKQMTQVLSEAGFENATAVEATLADHVKNGGNLDLEAVMAAAIATSISNPVEANVPDEAKRQSQPSSSVELNSGNTLTNQKVLNIADELSQDVGANQMVQDRTDTTGSPPDSIGLSFRGNPGRRGHEATAKTTVKNSRSEKWMKKQKNIKQVAESTTPSGWDLLFPEAKTAPDASAGKRDGQDRASPHLVKGSSEEDRIPKGPKMEQIIRNGQEQSTDQYSSMRASFDYKEMERDHKGHGSQREGPVYGQRPMKSWMDRGRGDRKRMRGQDFHHSRGAGRNRSKRERRVDYFNSDRNQASYANPPQWSNSSQFGPSAGVFPPMVNMADLNMGGAPPGLGPLPSAHQQALQRHMFQQQLLQQQAMHQEVIQQQAMQQQAFLQQAAHQDALRQQAALMQMSNAGLQPGGMVQPVFSAHEFNGYATGAADNEMQGVVDQGLLEQQPRVHDSWGRGKNKHNGYGGRGRARGRHRGHGRGNRWR